MMESIKGKPVFYNDFDGNFGTMEMLGNEPYILIPQWRPESLFKMNSIDLDWEFLGYAGEKLSAAAKLKVLALQFENGVEGCFKGMKLLTERLLEMFPVNDEAFTLTVEVDHIEKDLLSFTLKHNLYGNEEILCKAENYVIDDDCKLDFWIGCISCNFEKLFSKAEIQIKEKKKSKKVKK